MLADLSDHFLDPPDLLDHVASGGLSVLGF